MDLSLLAYCEEPVNLVLKHPITGNEIVNDNETQPMLKMMSMEREEVKQLRRDFQDKANKKTSLRKDFIPALAYEKLATTIILACLKGWDNVFLGGEELAYSRENAKKLLAKLPWVEAQITEFLQEEANFIKAS